jgi:hypothetical protein
VPSLRNQQGIATIVEESLSLFLPGYLLRMETTAQLKEVSMTLLKNQLMKIGLMPA